jgi:hypothetical protein
MQRDDPSWRSNNPKELAGKGETALAGSLAFFRKQPSFSDEELGVVFAPMSGMDKLYDVTGRNDDEIQDAEARADIMLRMHNPTAMGKANVQIAFADYKRAKRS